MKIIGEPDCHLCLNNSTGKTFKKMLLLAPYIHAEGYPPLLASSQIRFSVRVPSAVYQGVADNGANAMHGIAQRHTADSFGSRSATPVAHLQLFKDVVATGVHWCYTGAVINFGLS